MTELGWKDGGYGDSIPTLIAHYSHTISFSHPSISHAVPSSVSRQAPAMDSVWAGETDSVERLRELVQLTDGQCIDVYTRFHAYARMEVFGCSLACAKHGWRETWEEERGREMGEDDEQCCRW